MRSALAILLICLPQIVHAEGTATQQYSFFSSFIQMIAALAIVIGLILLTRHFSNRFLGGTSVNRLTSKHIRLVETRYIAPKKSLVLVEVGGEYLLLSSTEDRLSLIKKVDVIEEIDVLEEPGTVRAKLVDLFRKDAGR